MSVALVKHKHLWLNCVVTSGTDAYARISEGYDSAGESKNPNVETHTFVGDSNAHHEVTGYDRQIALSGIRVKGDASQDWIKTKAGKVGVDCHTDLVVVTLDDGETSGSAMKYDVTISDNSEGGDGAAIETVDQTIYINGEGVSGTFNETTKTFTATA